MNFTGVLNLLQEKLVRLVSVVLVGLKAFGDAVIGQLLSSGHAFFPTVNWAAWHGYLDNVNYFFPLSETITLATGYFGLWSLVVMYRLAKSWIPTVSGT